ncbi:glycosyltransferase family 4 protein [Methanosarcina sp. T3]|uniref:glycosyltransferase family 4 protein n=1 Tax=Methanosarcina sp. T3 TaxID=3439062 RepID=UPI003F856F4D
MNILAIPTTFGFSHPISGSQNRFSNLITELKKRGNNIILLESNDVIRTSDSKFASTYSYEDLKIFNRNLSIFKDFNLNFINKVSFILKNEDPNLVQITHPSGAVIIKLLCILKKKKTKIVYDAHNVESDFINETFSICSKYSKIEMFLVYKYTALLEKIVCKFIVDHILSVSDQDKTIFLHRYCLSPEKVSVIPSGVHLPDLSVLKSNINLIKKDLGLDPSKFIIVFHGAFSHPPNKRAFEIIKNYIAPQFKENSNVLFLVGGSGFPEFHENNVRSLGFIKDLYGIISIADIAIVPLTHGAGTKLKIFDYFSVGLPVITTKKGIEGINAINNEHVIIVDNNVDSNVELVNSIKYLIDNESERKRIGENARKLAEEKYDFKSIGGKLNVLYRNIKR